MSTSRGVSVQSARTPPVHCYTYDTYNRGDLRLWSRQKKGAGGWDEKVLACMGQRVKPRTNAVD